MQNFTENIDDYKILGLLGTGGFAKVWHAVFKGTTDVAVKIVSLPWSVQKFWLPYFIYLKIITDWQKIDAKWIDGKN